LLGSQEAIAIERRAKLCYSGSKRISKYRVKNGVAVIFVVARSES
jgi:hypothetical protein